MDGNHSTPKSIADQIVAHAPDRKGHRGNNMHDGIGHQVGAARAEKALRKKIEGK